MSCARALILAMGAVTQLAAQAGAQAGSAPASGGGSPADEGVSGSLTTRYRGRFVEGASDHDLYELLALDVERGAWKAHLVGQLVADVDGREDDQDGFVFFSLQDTHDTAVTGRLDAAWIERGDLGRFEAVRIGRQLALETPLVLSFDGVSVRTRELGGRRCVLGASAGVPVHTFESSSSGDGLLDAFVQTRPWRTTRLRLDWMHLDDESRLGKHDDDLLALAVDQGIGERLDLELDHSRLEGEPRDVRVGLRAADAELALVAEVSYYELLEAQSDLAVPLDPLESTLIALFPFRQLRATVSKALGAHVELALGLDARRVDDADDVGEFNRDFDRFWGTLATDAGLGEDTTLSLSLDRWHGATDDFTTLGLGCEHELSERTRVELGTDFSLFKYELYTATERDDVRTWYARLRHEAGERATLDLRYELEDDDADLFHVLRAGLTWRF
jgi:hypothetical protein